jgi:hypothetical protein
MIHRTAPSRPRLERRSSPRTRQTLTTLSGLAIFLTAAIGLAPTASATLPPPEPSIAPVSPPPPPTAAPAHFPLWAIVTILAATVALSVATTLVTLTLHHMRRARRTPAAVTEPQAGARTPAAPGPETGQAEVLSSHQAAAVHDRH